MSSGSTSDFGYVVTMLANRLKSEPSSKAELSVRWQIPEDQKVVFLLGAGCSRQYGLPSFQELLTYFWQDCYHGQPDSSWSFETLRDGLDQYWRALGPEARKNTLKLYLNRISGKDCPAYLRLATMASRGHVKAIINMNFDTLLEDALKAEQVPFQVSTSFAESSDRHLMIYKPHGSIGEISSQKRLAPLICNLTSAAIKNHLEIQRNARIRNPAAARTELMQELGRIIEWENSLAANDLILDIANSDLFSNPNEQEFAQKLLTDHDVVVIGYSGVDAKIVAALRAFAPGKDKKDRKLFAINVSRPDPRLLLVMAERSSQDLLVVGEDGGFENFMEYLERAVEGPVDFDSPSESTIGDGLTFMTRSERAALAECLRLALSIRAGINVADRSTVTIEQHGHAIYRLCLKLANAAGDCLRPPEKFLLYAAAFLHDLGYFAAYSGATALNYPGWKLLNEHGLKTETLIKQRIPESIGDTGAGRDEPIVQIMPKTYSNLKELRTILLYICAHHSTWREKYRRPAPKTQIIDIYGREVQVRPDLLQTLFAAAEDLAMEHPFLPSPDPVMANDERRWVVEDPVLDLFLRRKKDEVFFDIERGKVIGRTRDGNSSKTALWILNDAAQYVARYKDASAAAKRDAGAPDEWSVEFVPDPPKRLLSLSDNKAWETSVTTLLAEALEDGLSESLRSVQTDIHIDVAALLASTSVLLSEIQHVSPELAIARQVIDSVERSLTREWIFDLYNNGRDIEALTNRLVRDHGRIFQDAQQKIKGLDSKVRDLLRKNLPELARRRAWFRLPAIEGRLGAIKSPPTTPEELAEYGFILRDLQRDLAFLKRSTEAQPQYGARHHQAGGSSPKGSATTHFEGGLKEFHKAASDSCFGWIADCLEIVNGEMGELGTDAESRPDKWRKTLAPALEYLQQLEKVSKDLGERFPDNLKVALSLLTRVEKGLGWQNLGIESDFLKDLRSSVQGAHQLLTQVKEEDPERVHRLARQLLTEAWELRQALDNEAVNEALRSLDGVKKMLETGKEAGSQVSGALKLLARAETSLKQPAACHVSSILDLLAIYTLGSKDHRDESRLGKGGEEEDPEPRVSFQSKTVTWALSWIEGTEEYVGNIILDTYLRLSRKPLAEHTVMEEALKRSFGKILYPAWRFFGRNLHDEIEAFLMAVVCFDLGSSRFRDEVVSGIQHLLSSDVVTWKEEEGEQWAFGHDGCTLCTSRLIYIFSHVRRLFPDREFERFVDQKGRKIDQVLRGLLLYFIRRDPEAPEWWGLGFAEEGSQLKSADYLAWAARSVAFLQSVDQEFADRTGNRWLDQIFNETKFDYQGPLLNLFRQRWSAVRKLSFDELLSEGAEEPHSLILSNVAITCLEIARQERHIEGIDPEESKGDLVKLAGELERGVAENTPLSMLSRFFVWPVYLLQDSVGFDRGPGEDSPALTAVKTCFACMSSPIWIREGFNAGSWGFNVKNTQAVVSPLIEFWRYVLAKEQRDKFENLFKAQGAPTLTGQPISPASATTPRGQREDSGASDSKKRKART